MIGLALTPEQYKTLLRMVYIANTIVNGHREDNYKVEYDDLEQYIFSRANDAGFPAATLRHKLEGEEHHHPSRMFESDPDINTFMDEYDEHILLEYLGEKLAERDIELKFGPDAKTKMPASDYDDLLNEIADTYDKEFLSNGIQRLILNDK